MVKKLFRHELSDLLKYVRFAWLGLLGASILTAFALRNASNVDYGVSSNGMDSFLETMFQLFNMGTVMLFVLAISTVWILTQVMIVVRFYRSMLSNEGYLTHSLPFTTTKLLNVKVVCGVIALLLDVLVIAAAVVVAVLPSLLMHVSLSEIFETIGLIFNSIGYELGTGYMIAAIIEGVLLVLVALASMVLYPVACMSVGQKFKNRILASVLIYIGVQWASQFVSNFFMFFISLPLQAIDYQAIGLGPYVLIIETFALVIATVLCALYYFVSRHMLTKELNLV